MIAHCAPEFKSKHQQGFSSFCQRPSLHQIFLFSRRAEQDKNETRTPNSTSKSNRQIFFRGQAFSLFCQNPPPIFLCLLVNSPAQKRSTEQPERSARSNQPLVGTIWQTSCRPRSSICQSFLPDRTHQMESILNVMYMQTICLCRGAFRMHNFDYINRVQMDHRLRLQRGGFRTPVQINHLPRHREHSFRERGLHLLPVPTRSSLNAQADHLPIRAETIRFKNVVRPSALHRVDFEIVYSMVQINPLQRRLKKKVYTKCLPLSPLPAESSTKKMCTNHPQVYGSDDLSRSCR